MGPENFALTVVRAPDRPGRSELLCRLHYPGPSCEVLIINSICHAVSLKINQKHYSLSKQASYECLQVFSSLCDNFYNDVILIFKLIYLLG